MVDIDDAAIEEAVHEGSSMDPVELFDLIERHTDAHPGAPHRAVTAYARALESRRDYSFDADAFIAAVDDAATDAETWEGPDTLYELDGDRISRYPERWHEELGGSSDVVEHLQFIDEYASDLGEAPENRGSSVTVPKDRLVNVLELVGRMDHEAAVDAIEDARENDVVREDADQHPEAGVFLAEGSQ